MFIDQHLQNTLAICSFAEMLPSCRFFYFKIYFQLISFVFSFHISFYLKIQENLFDANNEDQEATIFRYGQLIQEHHKTKTKQKYQKGGKKKVGKILSTIFEISCITGKGHCISCRCPGPVSGGCRGLNEERPRLRHAGHSWIQSAPTHPPQGAAEPFRQCGSTCRENRFKKGQKILE